MFAKLTGRLSWPFIFVVMLSLSGCEKKTAPVTPTASSSGGTAIRIDEKAIAEFLQGYWRRPLPSQGKSPFLQQDHPVTLAPASCGTCHISQYQDWSQSLHSHAMGPGIRGQLVDMPAHAREDHQNCIRCHAPLAEQADSLVAALEKKSSANKITSTSSFLHEQGVVCAACHVRNYQWNGPMRRDGSQPQGDLSAYPHGGWKGNAAFESSQFCAACHQFKTEEYALNGKLMENTYQEWLSSPFAKQGIACQSCHMPLRRHLWRGIHDPEMTKRGVTIQVEVPAAKPTLLSAELRLKNTGTGHDFPTYVTPRVIIEGYQTDAQGEALSSTRRQMFIARQVQLDMSAELSDTRLAPGQEARFTYQVQREKQATALILRVRVEPDAFYTDFYQTVLNSDQTHRGRKMLKAALDHSQSTGYVLFEKKVVLSSP